MDAEQINVIEAESASTASTERHQDLNAIHTAIRRGVSILVTAVIPLMGTGVWMLIAGYFQQQEMSRQQASMNTTLSELNLKMEDVSKKVAIMWYTGKWEKSALDHGN
jgi:hypothetical protein